MGYTRVFKKKKINHHTTSMLPTGYSPSAVPLKASGNRHFSISQKAIIEARLEYFHVQPCICFGR